MGKGRLLIARIYLIPLILLLLAVLVRGVLAFSTAWQTHFDGGSGELNQWARHLIGDCGGQNHTVSGSSVQMRANYGTDCFGAYYRENAAYPGTFPTAQDVRVMWRWRYPTWGKYGTQAGQVTGRYGGPQYYGVSGVDTGNGDTDYAHVEANGPWGAWNVDRPLWRTGRRDTGWHSSTFDFICDGQQLAWWVDGQRIHQVTNASALPAGHESRPYQFWFGNLLSSTPSNGDWTGFDLDYVYVYAVERPQMQPPGAGAGGTQAVSWQAVANTPQPGGSSWGIQYQARACTDPGCAGVVGTSNWQSGTSYTFSGLEVNRTYHYQARAKWVGTPELVTCWSSSVSAQQVGVPDLKLAKNATTEAGPGEVIRYSLILQNAGSAAAGGVVVRDPLPSFVTNPTQISSGGAVQGNEVVWPIGTLAAGASRTLSWQGTVDPAVPTSVDEIVNVATATDNAGHSDQAQATTEVLIPGLSLTKTAPPELKPGEVFSYVLTVHNTGNMILREVEVRDPVPVSVLEPDQISHGGRLDGSEISWPLGELAPGERLILSWQGRVDPLIPVGQTQLVNQATVHSSLLDVQAEATSAVLQPEMAVIKSATNPVLPGETISYQIDVINRGNTTLFQVRVEDLLPAYVMPVAHSTSDGGYEAPGRLVWDNLGDIGPGERRQVTWQGLVDPLIPITIDQIQNVAVATTGSGLSEQAAAISELRQPGLSLHKEASSTAYAGGGINYFLTVTNNGPGLARFVEVHDPLPAYTGFVPDVGPSINYYGTLEGNEVVWQLNELAPGQAVTLRWRAQVNVDVPAEVDLIINEARARSFDTPEPVLASASTQLLDPDLQLDLTCPTFAQAGDALEYTLGIENGRPGVLREAVVRVPLPAGTSYVPGSASGGGHLIGHYLVWELGTLAPGVRVELRYALQVDPELEPDHVAATAQATSPDGTAQANCQTALVVPTLAIAKQAPTEALANDVIDYTLTVTNTGPVMAYQTVLTDILPAGADYVPGSVSDGGLVGEADIVWQLGALAPGQALSRHFQMVVHAPQGISEAPIYNEAVASARRTSPVRAATLTDVPRPVLHLTKRAPAEVAPGGIISYSLRGGNLGPGLARQALIRDRVPAGLIVLDDTVVAAGGIYDPVSGAVSWPLGDLAAGQTVERHFSVLAPLWLRPGRSTLNNLAFISSPDAAPQYAQASTQITATFTVVGEKRATLYVEPGGQINYSIAVHNGSPNLAADVVIRDPLPEFTTYLTNTASLPPAFEDDGQILIWSLGTLAAGETREVRFATQVNEDLPDWVDRLTNVGRVSYSGGGFEVRAVTGLPGMTLTADNSPPPPAIPPTAEIPEATPVPLPTETPLSPRPPVVDPPGLPPTEPPLPGPSPVLRKSVLPATVTAGPGATITWTLHFSNPTTLAIDDLVIRDALPMRLVYAGGHTGQGQLELTGDLSQTVVVAHLGEIPPGGQVEIELITGVLSDTVAGTVYPNTATYTALNLDPGASNEARVVVDGGPALLPVTGGPLDPRTPAGKMTWGGGILALLITLLSRSGRLQRLSQWAREMR
jgi:uncharacterized repeat protein (TIGR01451 family)